MDSIIQTQPTTPKATLLTLPLEIRLLIYSFIPPTNTRRPHYFRHYWRLPTEAYHKSTNPADLPPYRPTPIRLLFRPVPYQTRFQISLVNRQLYHETKAFKTHPELTSSFTIDLNDETRIIRAANSAMADGSPKECFVRAEVLFMCLKNNCRHVKLIHRLRPLSRFSPVDQFVRFKKLYVSSILQASPRSIPSSTFQTLTALLNEYPNLRELHLFVDHGSLMEWFTTPSREFDLLVPLLKRGVHVSLRVNDVFNSPTTWDNRNFVYREFCESLRLGGGDVIVRGDVPNFLSSIRLVLRSEAGPL